MSRRLDIELTSRRPDGDWTWRAAGARQPKGQVSGTLIPESADVGTVLKAEADGGLDGLEITAVFVPRSRTESEDRLELISRRSEPLVTARLVSKGARRGDDSRSESSGERRKDRSPRRGRDKDRSKDSSKRGERPRDRERPRDGERRRDDDTKRRDRSHGDSSRSGKPRRDRDSSKKRSDGEHGRGRRKADGDRQTHPNRPRGSTLKAKRVHRKAALAALPPEQEALAREVLKGGVPGVRRSVERMNAKAAAEKLPQINSELILALAERLAPVLKAAEWHDRADAAMAGIARIDLRDIRSVIAAAERAARTDETRALAESLREGLAKRLEVDQRKWLDELALAIAEGRTVRALRLSSRPPRAGTPLPPDMAQRLAAMAGADLNANASQLRWVTVVESVALAPVRTQVVPEGLPERPREELLTAVRRLADRVPQIARMFGIEAPSAAPRPAAPAAPPPPPPPAAPAPPSEPAAPEAAAAPPPPPSAAPALPSEPAAPEAAAAVPSPSEPAADPPAPAEPVVSEHEEDPPSTSQPVASEPAEDPPSPSQPVKSEPAEDSPSPAEPAAAAPVAASTPSAEPAASEPSAPEAAAVAPSPAESAADPPSSAASSGSPAATTPPPTPDSG